MTKDWSDIWPTKTGWYWFLGCRFTGFEIELVPVRVVRIANGMAYIAGSHFLHRAEGAEGYFYPAELPPWPKGLT